MIVKLFLIFFKLGFFAFGGGYSMISLIEREVVDNYKIVDKNRFVNIISVAEGLPGAIGVNVAIFIGFVSNGIIGALAAMLGSVLPCLIIITTIMISFANISTHPVVQSALYGIRPMIVSLIIYASYKVAKQAYKYKWYFSFTIVGFLIAMFAKQIPLPLIIIGGLILGIVLNLVETKFKLKEVEV